MSAVQFRGSEEGKRARTRCSVKGMWGRWRQKVEDRGTLRTLRTTVNNLYPDNENMSAVQFRGSEEGKRAGAGCNVKGMWGRWQQKVEDRGTLRTLRTTVKNLHPDNETCPAVQGEARRESVQGQGVGSVRGMWGRWQQKVEKRVPPKTKNRHDSKFKS